MARVDEEGAFPEFPPRPDTPNIILSQISSSESSMADLAKYDPGRLIGIAEEHNRQLGDYFKRRNDFDHKREENRHKEEKGRQSIVFASLGVVVAIVVSAFLYSGLTKDNKLSEKVLDSLLGVLGGSGAAALVIKRKSTED
jgi:hypothetical protein